MLKTIVKYQIEAFSWRSDWVAPEIENSIEDLLGDAVGAAKKLFEDPKVFQVRVLSEIGSQYPQMYNLHFMRCRPTEDRTTTFSFQKIRAVKGVTKAGSPIDLKVLRIRDFNGIPVNHIYLKSFKFFVANNFSAPKEPVLFEPSYDNDNARSECLEKCIGEAASSSHGIACLLQGDDHYWDYLSEIDVSSEEVVMLFITEKFTNL